MTGADDVEALWALSKTIRPSSISIRRSMRAAMSRSWVMTTIVTPMAWRCSNSPKMACPVAWSRLPVGSSANTIAGLPTRARAIATRWRCPPESWFGRAWGRPSRPTSLEGVEGTGPPLCLGDPGVEEAVGHVVEHALVLGQEELLEHEADPGGPQRGQLPVGEPLDVEAGDADVPGAGPVQGAHQMQQRGFARPRRAHDPHQLALLDGERDSPQGGHRWVARVDLGHLVDLEHRPVPAVGRRGGGGRRTRA